jgi:hypothetical protein
MSRQAKPGSKPYRAELRERLAALGFRDDVVCARVAENLITECRIRPRTAWRLACELSLEMAAAKYNAITGDPRAGMRGSRIWEYEQWPDRGVRPTVPALRVLAQMYGTSWQSLLALHDLEHLPAKDLAEYHDDVQASAATPPAIAAVRRPAQVTSLAPDLDLAPSLDLAPTGGGALADAMLLTGTNVDDTQLDDMWSDINYLSNAYTRASPDSVLRQLSVVQRQAATLLRGRQRPKQTTDLYLVNAKCCAMMAWISGDLGRYSDAQELNSSAWLYTQSADDYLARRWVRTTQARVAFWAGNAVESAQLAADGLKYKVGGQLNDAPLILAEARGWSSVQAESQVLDAIARWTRIEDAHSETEGEERFFNISKDRRHYMAGTSLLSVGQTTKALGEFQTARQAYDAMALEHRWEAMEPMIRIDTGRAHLQRGDLDAAAAEVEPLLTADVSRQPDMVRSMLEVLTKELADPRWDKAKVAQNLVDALMNGQRSIRR